MFLKVSTVCKLSSAPTIKKDAKGKETASCRAYCTVNLENVWLRIYLDGARFSKVLPFLEPRRYIYVSGNAFIHTHKGKNPTPGYTVSLFVESLNLLSKEFHAILESETFEEDVSPTEEEEQTLELDLEDEFKKQL